MLSESRHGDAAAVKVFYTLGALRDDCLLNQTADSIWSQKHDPRECRKRIYVLRQR